MVSLPFTYRNANKIPWEDIEIQGFSTHDLRQHFKRIVKLITKVRTLDEILMKFHELAKERLKGSTSGKKTHRKLALNSEDVIVSLAKSHLSMKSKTFFFLSSLRQTMKQIIHQNQETEKPKFEMILGKVKKKYLRFILMECNKSLCPKVNQRSYFVTCFGLQTKIPHQKQSHLSVSSQMGYGKVETWFPRELQARCGST